MTKPHERNDLTIAFLLLLAILALAQSGCSERRTLAATPNMYHNGHGREMFDAVPLEKRGTDIEVLYVTDRAIKQQAGIGPIYGHDRTKFLTYGTATVSLSPAVTWDELVDDSTSANRKHLYTLKTTSVRELGTLKNAGGQRVMIDGKLVVPPWLTTQIDTERQDFQKLIAGALQHTNHKDVYIYVHGFANTFDDSVFRCAELWHFLGRRGVAIAYTWPAGHGGVLGYFHDRESGEYTILHLKQFLRTLAEVPEVERIHLIAHSRGTDVVATAIREINIGAFAAGKDTQKVLKLQTLILASPDLDADIFRERFVAENVDAAAAHLVIYFSPNDTALGIANWLFSGKNRLGQMAISDFTPEALEALKVRDSVDFVNCDVTGYSTSHDYEFAHPAVLSDLILVLRDGRQAGAQYGRPLKNPMPNLWQITNDYALPGPATKPSTEPSTQPTTAPSAN